jgi:hypothetical protein
MVRQGALDRIGSSGFEPAGTDASVGAKTRVSNVIREGLSVGSKRGHRKRKRPPKGGLDERFENDPYYIRKDILPVGSRAPRASGSEGPSSDVDIEIVLFRVKRFSCKVLIENGFQRNLPDRCHQNSPALTDR